MSTNLDYDGGKLMIEAAQFAAQAHKGQNRKYHAQPYITHPARIASTLMTKGATPELVAAAWLHDVVEDCGVEHKTIIETFGDNVAYYVWAMTNPSKGLRASRSEKKLVDKEHWAAITNANAQWLKAEDRLDNLRDAWAGPKDWRVLYAKESSALIDVLTLAPDDIRQDCYNVIDHLLGISE